MSSKGQPEAYASGVGLLAGHARICNTRCEERSLWMGCARPGGLVAAFMRWPIPEISLTFRLFKPGLVPRFPQAT